MRNLSITDGALRPLGLIALALIAICVLPSGRVDAQQEARKPVPWIVSVSHGIDLDQYAEKKQAQTPGAEVEVLPGAPRHVINLTSGILIDSDGHIVTRLVNLDPSAPTQDLKVTTSTGKIVLATLVGLDGPTGLAILSAPDLRGTQGAPVETDVAFENGATVTIVTPMYSLQKVQFKVERVALYPKLQPFPGKLNTIVPTLLGRTGVRSLVESGVIASSNDLSTVETLDGKVMGVVKYVSPGRGHILPLGFLRDTVAKRVVLSKGSIAAGWLGADGISLSDIPPPTRPAGIDKGVLIQRISSDGPADVAGLKRFDLVVALDEVEVQSAFDLATAITSTPAGTKVTLGIVREGQPLTLQPVLTSRPGAHFFGKRLLPSDDREHARLLQLQIDKLQGQRTRAKTAEERAKIDIEIKRLEALLPTEVPRAVNAPESLGLTFQELTPQLADFFGVDYGILVARVDPEGPAAPAGIRAGDVLVQFAGAPIRNADMLNSAFQRAVTDRRTDVEVLVHRDHKPVTVTIQIPKPLP